MDQGRKETAQQMGMTTESHLQMSSEARAQGSTWGKILFQKLRIQNWGSLASFRGAIQNLGE